MDQAAERAPEPLCNTRAEGRARPEWSWPSTKASPARSGAFDVGVRDPFVLNLMSPLPPLPPPLKDSPVNYSMRGLTSEQADFIRATFGTRQAPAAWTQAPL